MMQDRVVLIFGRRGSGKSTLARKICSQYDRVLIFDPRREYTETLVVSGFIQLAQYFKMISPSTFTIAFRPTFGFSLAEQEQEFEFAGRLCWEIGNMLLVLEEIETYLSSYDRENFINFLISQGRHKRISLVGIGRRPGEIPIKLRSQVSDIVSFSQTEPNDLNYLQQWGFEPQSLQGLPLHEYIRISENGESTDPINSLDWQ